MTKTTVSLSRSQIEAIEAEARDNGVLKQYRSLVARGESPRMSLMISVRTFPGLKGTDTQFVKLENQRVKEISDEDMTRIQKRAKAAGIATAGKTYNGALGKYEDPLAWVSDTHDVRLAAKEKGLSLSGQVNVKNEPKPLQKRQLSERLIKETSQAYIDSDPALAERCRKSKAARSELRDKVVEKHSSKRK